MQDTAKRIGARFLTLRRRLKYTQEQVAEKSGINATYYGRVERGEANISLGLVVSIADRLGVSLSELLDIEPEKDRAQLMADFSALLETVSDDELKLAYKVVRDVLR